jgi:uncharacterized membrane protein YhaH (DUF805 family)
MTWYSRALKNYAVFTGRARRMELWAFTGLNFLIYFALMAGDDAMRTRSTEPTAMALILVVHQLATLLPSIAVSVRRMHDTGHSGWWCIVPIASFILSVRDGDRGPNRYGPDPKADALVTDGGSTVPVAS